MDRQGRGPALGGGILHNVCGSVMDFVGQIDGKVNRSTFGRIFRLRGCGHPQEIGDATFLKELRAGLTTFATMSYIIAVNSSILSQTGANCHKDDKNCLEEIKREFVTATAAISGLASILFGWFTNMPVALAPGMGLNAYFTYQVVGINGSGPVSYNLALTAVFVEGFIFMFLALTGMRQWLVKIIPNTIKTASGVGIGLFLTLMGMSYSSGIGLVTGSRATPLALGGCPLDARNDMGECTGQLLQNPKMWLGILGSGIFTAFLMAFRVKSAIVIGILLVSILSWPRNTSFTYFPLTPDGDERFDFFKQVVAFKPMKHILAAQDWNLSRDGGSQFCLALFTFLYVDIIDCTATLYSMARFSQKVNTRDGDFPRSTIAYCTDALCISISSLFGCSPVTAFIESGAGIAEGGRTGLTAVVTGCCFLISIFFAPIFASIPPWATGSTLILVGCLMMRQVSDVNWRYVGDAIPSFVAIALIPFSYSVAYGLIGAIFVYTVLNTLIWLVMFITRGTFQPREYDIKEYWTWKPAGEKPWVVRKFTRDRFWADKTSGEDNGSSIDHSRPGSADEKPEARVTSPQRCMLRRE